jgi:hypothetical protein
MSGGLLLAVAALVSAGSGAVAAEPGDLDGEWAGTLVATQGTCPDHAPSRLLVDRKTVSFVPAGGVLVLHGTRRPGIPRLHAQLLLTDMNRKPLPMVFEGSLASDGQRIDGTYGTPACRAHVTLLRPESHPLQRLLGK